MPRLADWCFVELLRDDGSIERAAIAADDPVLLEDVREYARRYPLDPDAPVGSPQVIRSGEAELQPDMPDEFLVAAAQDEDHLRLMRALGFRSYMIVPLRAGGRVLGDLALVSAASGRRFGPDDLAAAQELADRCSLYLDNARLHRQLGRARDELEAILAGIADAVTVQDASGRLSYANDAAARLLGFADRAALLAAPVADLAAAFEILDTTGHPVAYDQLPGRRVLAGEHPEPMTVRYRVRATGESRWSRIQARPLHGPDGRVTHAINVTEDITELKQAEEHQRILAEAGRVLAGTLDYDETLVRVAWLAVPELADWAMLDVMGEHGLERVAIAHADPRDAEMAAALRGVIIDPHAEIGPAAVFRTGRAELHPHVDPAHMRRSALNPRHHDIVARIGVRSAASVPLTVRGQRLGVMTLSTAASGRSLGPEQFSVLEELGRRAAVAVENARLHRQRSAIARTLQDSLLPPALPEIPGLEAAAVYRAAGEGTEVGGDFYDLFSVGDDEWIAVIGDVCGKGAEAAAVTALARYTIRTAAFRRRSPAAILRWLNDAMLRHDLAGRFCTITCVHLDTGAAPHPGDGVVRRAPARAGAPRGRQRRGDRTAGDAAGARARPGAPGRRDGARARRRARPLHGRRDRGARARARARGRGPPRRAAQGAGLRAADRRAPRGARGRQGRQAAARRHRDPRAARGRLRRLSRRSSGCRSPCRRPAVRRRPGATARARPSRRRSRGRRPARRRAAPPRGSPRRTARTARSSRSGPALEVGDLFLLGVGALAQPVALLLRLALALLLPPFLAQRRVVREVSGGLLHTARDLVGESHVHWPTRAARG